MILLKRVFSFPWVDTGMYACLRASSSAHAACPEKADLLHPESSTPNHKKFRFLLLVCPRTSLGGLIFGTKITFTSRTKSSPMDIETIHQPVRLWTDANQFKRKKQPGVGQVWLREAMSATRQRGLGFCLYTSKSWKFIGPSISSLKFWTTVCLTAASKTLWSSRVVV